ASQVTLTLTETGRRQPLVLIRRTDRQADAQADHQADRQASSGECSRLGLLWNHADATIELGMPAPDALEPAGLAALDRCGIVAVRVPCRLEDCPSTVWSWLAGAARRGARFVVLDEQLSAATTALLAAGLPHAPVLWLGRIDRRLARDPAIATLLRRTTAPVVLTIPTSDLDIVAEVLASTAAGQAIAVPDSRLDCGVAARWLADDAGATPEATVAAVAGSSREETTLVVAPGQGEADHTDLAPVVLALIDAGVSPRTLGCALRPFGMGRRQVYQAIRGKEGE
ncbi:MAG: hypothetical protein JXA67_03830, partial [Micromonosporaceae bacterium]|nr:hypothetical protein [Micromonosporaceae bacterium]